MLKIKVLHENGATYHFDFGPYARIEETEKALSKRGWRYNNFLRRWEATNDYGHSITACIEVIPTCSPRNKLPYNRAK